MALSIDGLTNSIRDSMSKTITITEYDPNTGQETNTNQVIKPEYEPTKQMVTELINHFKNNADVFGVEVDVQTTVIGTSPSGPVTGNGTGKGSQPFYQKGKIK